MIVLERSEAYFLLMKKRTLILQISLVSLSALLLSSLPSANAASYAPRTKCPIVGAKAKSGKVNVVCVKVGTALKWKKVVIAKKKAVQPSTKPSSKPSSQPPIKTASGPHCADLTKCQYGEIGPGGGTIFWSSASYETWGHFAEVAPAGWYGSAQDPQAAWCDNTTQSLKDGVTDATAKDALGMSWGMGKANTDLMVSRCLQGAAVMARGYRGGGKTDWFLPSTDELNGIFSRKNFVGGLSADSYWTSTEVGSLHAWFTNMVSGDFNESAKTSVFRVRPIRVF